MPGASALGSNLSGQKKHIAFKELFAILLACAVWGRQWQLKRVRCWSDNQAAVQGMTSRCCRNPTFMHLLHGLFFMEAHSQFELVASHISGKDNRLADDLSRNCLYSFFSKAPLMDPLPSIVPLQVPRLLLEPDDWMSPTWTRWFATTFTAK